MEPGEASLLPWDNYKDQGFVNCLDTRILGVTVSLYPLEVTIGRQTSVQITSFLCWVCVCVLMCLHLHVIYKVQSKYAALCYVLYLPPYLVLLSTLTLCGRKYDVHLRGGETKV